MNWNMYLFVFAASKNLFIKFKQDCSAVMSLDISDVSFFGLNKFFRVKKRVMLKLAIFTNDESSLPVLESLSNNVIGLQAVRLGTLLDLDTGVSETAICRYSTK